MHRSSGYEIELYVFAGEWRIAPKWDLSTAPPWMEKDARLTKLLANLANNRTDGPSSSHNSDKIILLTKQFSSSTVYSITEFHHTTMKI